MAHCLGPCRSHDLKAEAPPLILPVLGTPFNRDEYLRNWEAASKLVRDSEVDGVAVVKSAREAVDGFISDREAEKCGHGMETATQVGVRNGWNSRRPFAPSPGHVFRRSVAEGHIARNCLPITWTHVDYDDAETLRAVGQKPARCA